MNAIILCGGLSTRLGDITKSIPKILLEVRGQTVLDWQIDHLCRLGVDTVVLAAGHLSEILRAAVGEERKGVRLVHAVEPSRLGTGGAIKFAWQFVPDQTTPVLVLNGDILADIDVVDLAAQLTPQMSGMILGAKVDDASSYGTLEHDEDGRLLAFKEKEGIAQSAYINGGFYLFNPSAKSFFPERDTFSIEYDVFPNMTGLYVYRSNRPWIDIGVPERLEWARKNWGGEA